MIKDLMITIKEPIVVLIVAVAILPAVVRGLAVASDWLESIVEHNANLRNIFHRLS